MLDNYERLVGRLMDLETKFYELQEKYHTLINDYEKLKEEHEKDRLRYRDQLGSRYDPFNRFSGH
jgi:ABC-type phosphate transport system auxiliary subunit